MVTGRILAESLRAGCDLRVAGLRLVRIAREDVSDSRTPDQPAVWTLIDVAGPDETADDLAAALAAALRPDEPWYADFRVAGDHVIVYSGRVFRYAMGDRDGREAAVRHGRSIGVPESQLDWGE
jgi:hypothetical protein